MRYSLLALIALAACPLFAQEPVRLPTFDKHGFGRFSGIDVLSPLDMQPAPHD